MVIGSSPFRVIEGFIRLLISKACKISRDARKLVYT